MAQTFGEVLDATAFSIGNKYEADEFFLESVFRENTRKSRITSKPGFQIAQYLDAPGRGFIANLRLRHQR
ncbi:hypothetical protein [Roseateles terrae]|uniref:Uncharacterized protein n=1 Tax=Roseateles terrae TaxID=431060 RepID=A0ABR6GN11_9BURK|nr:hypothetical protein [Roseateles terrae]MBB3193464.1 hypothetical protein [Roseateles terrae]